MPVELNFVIFSIACPVAYLRPLSRDLFVSSPDVGVYCTLGINDQDLFLPFKEPSSDFGGFSRIIFPL